MKNLYYNRGTIFRLEVTYPAASLREYEERDAETESIETFTELDPNWKPEGWEASADWVERFHTDRFFWPAVKPFYNTRSTANERARLFRKYGATVVVRQSRPIEWEYTEAEVLARRVRELEDQLATALLR
ncbi:hypothetical protein ACL9RL_09425 [Plantibacter sp. Mn2098]|uniref:hypothetical protein n=1 Tax=Plantibacter sp. Mn2098 TaxID=3395266 RepID=UPI003BD27EC8